MNNDSSSGKEARKISQALQNLAREVSFQEKLHRMGLFTMKNPGNKNALSECSVYQTPFSMFILFDEIVLRVDQPFEFIEVAPRKSQQGESTTSKKRSYRLKCKLAGTNRTFMLFRSADFDKNLYLAEKDLMKDVRLPFFLESFTKHLGEVEEIIDAVNIEAKRLNPGVTTLLSMQMFVDALYSEWIKRPSYFQEEREKDPFAPVAIVVFGPLAHLVLRYLLEYGKSPNQFGCYGQAGILEQDIKAGLSSKNGISLSSLQDIIHSIDSNLAKKFSGLSQKLISLSFADAEVLRLNRQLLDDELLDWP